MKLAIVGAGAVGCYLGAKLSASEAADVTVVERGLAQIRQQDISISGLDSNHAKAEVRAIGYDRFLKGLEFDVILVMTKAYDVNAVLFDLKQNAFKGQVIVGCNGIGFDQGARISTWTGVLRLEPYKIKVVGESRIEIFGAKEFETVLVKAGIELVRYPSCAELEWQKAICNIGTNALATLAQKENGIILENSLLWESGQRLVLEGVTVAKGLGVELGAGVLDRYRNVLRSSSKNTNSTLAGLRRGEARTEIPWLNGVVSREGRRLGIPVPLNDMVSGIFT